MKTALETRLAATRDAVERWLLIDSDIRIGLDDRQLLQAAIRRDVVYLGMFPPTDAEVQTMVCGCVDTDEGLMKLLARYPHTSRFIASFFE